MKSLKITTVILLTAIILVPLMAQIPPDGWEEPAVVSSLLEEQIAPIIAVNDNYSHTCWNQYTPDGYKLWYFRSTNWGFNWSAEQQISAAGLYGEDGLYDIAADTRGYVYCVWSEQPQPNQYELWFRYSTDHGATWPASPVCLNPILDLTHTVQIDPNPRLTVDGADTLRLSFIYHFVDQQVAKESLCYAHYYSNAWSLRERISDLNPTLVNVHDICARSPQNKTHVAFSSRVAQTETYEIYHAVRNGVENWEIHEITQIPSLRMGTMSMCRCPNGYLHVGWAYKQGVPQFQYNRYSRSTNDGVEWSTPYEIFPIGHWGLSLTADNKGVHGTTATEINEIWNLWYRRSTDFGANWPEPEVILTDGSTSEKSPSITSNAMGRFIAYDADQYGDIGFMAYYDSLLSDDPNATAYNWGRHLYRVPEVNNFHLVYQSKGKVRYTHSESGFEPWAPFHRLDNGAYPTVGYVMTPNHEWHAPVIAYIPEYGNQIRYRWYDDLTQQWYGFDITPPFPYDIVGPPSLTTAGYDVCLTFSARSLMFPASAIIYYQFPFYSQGPGNPFPVATSPGFFDLSAPCVAYDYFTATGNVHVTYDSCSNIHYRMKDWQGLWGLPQDVSQRTVFDFPADTAFVEAWGDMVYCDWVRREESPSTEVFRNKTWIGTPWPFWWIENRSQSPYESSDYPVGVIGDFSVWTEPPPMVATSDIRYLSDTWGYGWVCTTPERSIFSHSQLWIDDPFMFWHLYNAWTEGSAVPYRVSTKELIFGGKGNPSLPVYYKVDAGDSLPSRYCTKRDTFVKYARFNVDLGRTELVYTLPFLNPLYPGYRLICVTYFEGTSTRKEQILIDGTDYGTFEFKPNRPETLSIVIPRLHYKEDHKVVVAFKGTPTTKVGLILYQLEKAGGGKGGVQALTTLSTELHTDLHVAPNPAKNVVHISYALNNRSEVSIRLFDVSGRMVRRILAGEKDPGKHVLSINTKDLSCGIYFLECKLGQDVRTEKVILMQ